MHDTQDVRKSIELDKAEFEIRKAHDREILVDEMERRIEVLERRFLKNEPTVTFSEVHKLLTKAGVTFE